MRRDRRTAVTLLGQPDRIRALAGAEIDQVGILAVAERDVWQLPPGRDVGKLLPLRIVNVEPGAASPHTAMYRLSDINSHCPSPPSLGNQSISSQRLLTVPSGERS